MNVPLNDANYLALVVEDGGDGVSCDWADWLEPRLVGPAGELKLSELPWKSAITDWGQVQRNQAVGGGPLRVSGRTVANGIGTHSQSLIEFDLPKGYTHFVAQAGLDNGGTDQGGGSSVKFLVYTTRPTSIGGTAGSRSPETALENLDVHPELNASLFAAEPMLLSPSNIDIDHRGRVWVCEIVNYRGHQGKRAEGDRILILEDSDGDGEADRSQVFYQGRDIDSPHGVCVLGNRVIVSAGSQVLCLTDEDGDDRADKKEVWFSGIHGVQHDHGIHAFMFGPDGKLYFNFGNEGQQLLHADGSPVVDLDGKQVSEHRQPYQQGMVFRCNLDRSQFETLAWNFRNNWMVTVDSFGTIWQSDNDDDGNRGVRINYVMPFGNFGYRDERTGAGWQTARTGMSDDPQRRQWHLDDPGVVPNLLHTGAGSPTGIMVYEGQALPSFLQSQLIHCDAGPSVTRAYTVNDDGAGYRAEMVNLLQGARDPWYRPSDVKSAPDGSLIIADWYDPGVGGHGMGDLDRGRLFRLTKKDADSRYAVPKFDFQSIDGSIAALKNPNHAVRYLAWQSLHGASQRAVPALSTMSKDANPVFRARALWLLSKLPEQAVDAIRAAATDQDVRIRCMSLRMATEIDRVASLRLVEHLANDSSPQVRRECAVWLRHVRDARVPALWAQLASQYDGQDRWYLEALGIGADDQWDACLEAWRSRSPQQFKTPAGHDIVWRSRAKITPSLLRELILDPAIAEQDLPRYFRALDLLEGAERDAELLTIAFSNPSQDERGQLILSESLARISPQAIASNDTYKSQLDPSINQVRDAARRVQLIGRFGLKHRYADVLEIAIDHPQEPQGIEALRLLLAGDEQALIQKVFDEKGEQAAARRLGLLHALRNSADNRAVPLLVAELQQDGIQGEERRAAVDALAHIRAGAEYLLQEAEAKRLSADLEQAAAASLQRVPWNDLRHRANQLFPVAPGKDNRPLPSLADLAQRTGDAQRGATVYRTAGTCVKCHVIRQEGKAVGPELSEIGKKLSRDAMYESILFPSAAISHSFESYTAELHDGNVVTGILVSQADDAIEIKNNEGLVRRIARSEIEHLTKQPISLMPADLHQAITEQELVDLVEFLTTLK